MGRLSQTNIRIQLPSYGQSIPLQTEIIVLIHHKEFKPPFSNETKENHSYLNNLLIHIRQKEPSIKKSKRISLKVS
jgi:hypothetical protein